MTTYDSTITSNSYILRTISSGEASPTANTKAIWRMNESSWAGISNEVKDSSGNLHHGTAYGTSSISSLGKIGRCGFFPGGSDYVLVPGSTDFNFGASFNFSISLWIKTYDIVTTTQCVFAKLNSAARYGYYVQIKPDNITFGIDEAGNTSEVDSTVSLDDQNWHHIVCVRDTSGTRLCLYVDGVLDNTEIVTPRNVNGVYTVNFGRRPDVSQYYSGYIDEVVVWNKALSISEVADLYYGGLAGFGVLSSLSVVDRHGLYTSIISNSVIKKINTKTINSNSSIQNTYTKALYSNTYIKKIDNTEYINSDSHIKEVFSNDIGSVAYILNTYPKILYSNSLIKKIDNEEITFSDAYVLVSETETINSDANILKVKENILYSNSFIKKITPSDINSLTYIKKLSNFSTRLSDAYIAIYGITKSINSLAYIQKSPLNIILSNAHIKKINSEILYSNSKIKRLAYEKTIASDAMIILGATKSIGSTAFVLKAEITNTLNSDAHILQYGYWSDVWSVTYKVTITEEINSNAFIHVEGLDSIYSNAYIKQAYTNILNSNYYILQTYTNILYSNTNIRGINTTQPQICDATYVNKPILYSAQINI